MQHSTRPPQRFAAALAASALAFAAAGCGRNSTPDGAGAKTIKIGVSIPAADHGWTGGVVYHAGEAKKAVEAANPGVRVIVSTAATSAEQVDRVENLLVQGIDALVILPSEPAPLSGVCERAVKAGVKLVVVDRNLANPVQHLLIAGDNPGFGRAAAEAIAKELEGKGSVVMMEGVQCDVNTDRVEAFKETLAKFPEIKILDSGSADWNTEKGLKLMENFLQKHPLIDAVWTGDDDVSIGALKAIEESGRKDIRTLVGGGGSKAIIKRVLDGDPLVKLTVTYPPAMIEAGVAEALKLLLPAAESADSDAGADATAQTITIPAEIVDASNAQQFYAPNSAY